MSTLFDDLRQAHLDEKCPTCKAPGGTPCKTPKGNKTAKPHRLRIYNGTILYQERVESGYYNERDKAQRTGRPWPAEARG